jgi:hypothetical protein
MPEPTKLASDYASSEQWSASIPEAERERLVWSVRHMGGDLDDAWHAVMAIDEVAVADRHARLMDLLEQLHDKAARRRVRRAAAVWASAAALAITLTIVGDTGTDIAVLMAYGVASAICVTRGQD